VQQCVFSSTGKASRYFTAEVYAASKKIAEWQFAQAVQQGKVTYSMVRFTHTLDNSLVAQQIDERVAICSSRTTREGDLFNGALYPYIRQ
jgi:hypothetical protein